MKCGDVTSPNYAFMHSYLAISAVSSLIFPHLFRKKEVSEACLQVRTHQLRFRFSSGWLLSYVVQGLWKYKGRLNFLTFFIQTFSVINTTKTKKQDAIKSHLYSRFRQPCSGPRASSSYP